MPAYALDMTAVRASGPGGQHVNATSSAVQLRVDLNSFYIPDAMRARIARHRDSRITSDNVVVIKAQGQRSQHRNRAEVKERLVELLREATHVKARRKRTRPSRSSVRRGKRQAQHRSRIKALRGTPSLDDY